MPHDLPPAPAVYQQARRRSAAGCIPAIIADRRASAIPCPVGA
jgi:hypothetical protein